MFFYRLTSNNALNARPSIMNTMHLDNTVTCVALLSPIVISAKCQTFLTSLLLRVSSVLPVLQDLVLYSGLRPALLKFPIVSSLMLWIMENALFARKDSALVL